MYTDEKWVDIGKSYRKHKQGRRSIYHTRDRSPDHCECQEYEDDRGQSIPKSRHKNRYTKYIEYREIDRSDSHTHNDLRFVDKIFIPIQIDTYSIDHERDEDADRQSTDRTYRRIYDTQKCYNRYKYEESSYFCESILSKPGNQRIWFGRFWLLVFLRGNCFFSHCFWYSCFFFGR